jgi:hypothetical protein
MGHQKAALEILTQVFTPQTVMQSPTSRMLHAWYARFDVFVGMIGGFETNLPREWFVQGVEFSESQIANSSNNLGWKIETNAAKLRLISMEMSLLYARGARAEISGEAFAAEHARITNTLYQWRENLDPDVVDSNHLVTDFRYAEGRKEDSITDPYTPGFLYKPPLFQTTILLCEWHSITVMHKTQEAMALQQEPSEELRALAMSICEIFEKVEKWPSSPNGALVIIQACLAIGALFVPRDLKHHMWLRRKYALLESLG